MVFAVTVFYGELVLCVPQAKKGDPAPGPFLISGSRDKTIRLWDVSTSLCLMTLVRRGEREGSRRRKMEEREAICVCVMCVYVVLHRLDMIIG